MLATMCPQTLMLATTMCPQTLMLATICSLTLMLQDPNRPHC